MSLRRLKPGDWLAGIGGVALLVSLFTRWYTVNGPMGRDLTAWQAFAVIDVVFALAALAGIALAVTSAVRRTPALPVALGVIGSVTGALAALLALVRVLDPPGDNALLEVCAGAWIGLAAAVLLAAGAWLSIGDERNRGVPDPPVEHRPAPPGA